VRQFSDAEKVPRTRVDVQVKDFQRMVFDKQHLDQVAVEPRPQRVEPRALSARARCESCLPRAPTSGIAVDYEVFDDGRGVARGGAHPPVQPFFHDGRPGTGLGLYIARELCEGNGARIEYVENPDRGQFRITLKGA
jgi:two-component system sensor histidine kinase PilS (NtrC family)